MRHFRFYPFAKLNSYGTVTRNRADKPSARIEELRPWLWLANLVPHTREPQFPGSPSVERLLQPSSIPAEPEPTETEADEAPPELQLNQLSESAADGETPDEGAPHEIELYPAFLRGAPRSKRGDPFTDTLAEIRGELTSARVRHAANWLYNLAYSVASAVRFYASGSARTRLWDAPGAVLQFNVDKDGRASIARTDRYGSFIDAIEGTDVGRIRRCPICESYFYVRRLTQRACSQRCNAKRRVREWRKSQTLYEQNRKFKLAGVKPERKKQ